MAGTTEYDPHEHADALGLEVFYGRLRAGNGLWVPDRRAIFLQRGMRVIQERSVLAHEIGHADLGHRDDRPKHEHLADRYAVHNLVNHDRFLELAPVLPDAARLSLELGVTTKLMQIYLNLHSHELRPRREATA